METFEKVTEAHGILGSLAWVIFLPLGAIVVRLLKSPNTWLIHGAIQLFGLVLFVVNFGQGIWMAMTGMFPLKSYHPAIGIVLFAFAWTQPFTGYAHHLLYKKKGGRTIISHIHIWLGRALITLGMIQGGLGLLYAGGDATRGENIAYGVIAAIIWLTYIGVIIFGESKKRGSPESRDAKKSEMS